MAPPAVAPPLLVSLAGMTGIQSLVATMQVQWQRHEVLANNLANLSTPGFKQDDLAPLPDGPGATAIGPAGGSAPPAGIQGMVQWTDYSQGALRETGRNLDVALNGPGFLVVDTPNGPRYTRAGALSVGSSGTLITVTGSPVT